jgi:hypothetical protein
VLVVVFVTETVGRPIAVGQDRGATMITSERRSAEAPETRRLLALKEEVNDSYAFRACIGRALVARSGDRGTKKRSCSDGTKIGFL